LLSIIPAILGSFTAMWMLSRNTPKQKPLLLAGIALGPGIGDCKSKYTSVNATARLDSTTDETKPVIHVTASYVLPDK
tara:strand:- start:785 stop:1018 length:234 start_codon:yes stop_codon:yes gene_type:complete